LFCPFHGVELNPCDVADVGKHELISVYQSAAFV
jgi:hypothetical protein